jgi:hypothetical protein
MSNSHHTHRQRADLRQIIRGYLPENYAIMKEHDTTQAMHNILVPLEIDPVLVIKLLTKLVPRDTTCLGASSRLGSKWVNEIIKQAPNRKYQRFEIDISQPLKVEGELDNFHAAALLWPIASANTQELLFKALAAAADERLARIQTIISMVDMQQGVREKLAEQDYTFLAIFKAEEFKNSDAYDCYSR